MLVTASLFSRKAVAELLDTPLVTKPVVSLLSTREGLSQDTINQLLIDKDGFLWIANDSGLDRYDGYQIDHITGPDNLLGSTPVHAVFQDTRQGFWISTNYLGLVSLDIEANEFKTVLKISYKDFPEFVQRINKFIELPSGELLLLFEEVVVLLDPETLEHRVIYSVQDIDVNDRPYLRDIILADQLLVLATSSGMFVGEFNEQNIHFSLVEHRDHVVFNEENLNTKSLYLQDNNTLWVGTVEGLYSMPWREVKQAMFSGTSIKTIDNVVPTRNIWQIQQADRNLIWLGTDIGLIRLQRTERSWDAQYILDPSLGTNAMSRPDIRALTLEPNNDLWIGTYISGAMNWSPKSLNFSMLQNQQYQDNDGPLSNNNVWALHEQTQSVLWIGTDNGLTKYNRRTGNSEFYIVDEGIPEPYSIHNIARILPLTEGQLLLETFAEYLLFDIDSGQYEIIDFGLPEDKASSLYGMAFGEESQGYFIGDSFYTYNFNTHTLSELTKLTEQVEPGLSLRFLGKNPLNHNEILLATFTGLWAYEPYTENVRLIHKLPESVRNSSIGADSVQLDKHILWIAYPGYGLVGIDENTLEQRHFFGREVFGRAVNLFDLTKDDDGFIWFSSLNGIHRFSPLDLSFVHYDYGQMLSIAEFNQSAATRLSNGEFGFGSPRGVLFFNPSTLNVEEKNSAISDVHKKVVISNISLSSRDIGFPLRNLSGTHISLEHDDFGLSIEFSPMVFNPKREIRFKYILRNDNKILSEDVTTDTKIVLPSLPPGDYRFEVVVAIQSEDQAILPASITINVDYPPFQSPEAYLFYVLVGVVLLGTYLVNRHIQLLNLKHAQHQVKLFGNAFKHTSDWVVIFNTDSEPVAANPAFEKAFGLKSFEPLDSQLSRLYQQVPKLERQLSGQLDLLKFQPSWKGEERIVMPDGRRHDVLIDINKMSEEPGLSESNYLVVISDITEQKNAERKLVKIANFDGLTGLINRNLLLDRLEHAIATATQHQHNVAVLFVDLDRFKGINDSLGHDYGDKLLRVVANRMLNQASKSDTVARLGGDEFVIVMEEVDGEPSVSNFVTKLIEAIETPISLGKEVLRVSCSVGVSFFPDDASDPAELLKQADVAMYTAKNSTINAFIYYTQEMNQRAVKRLALENKVKSAFDERKFINHYQPIVNVKTGKTEGVELLLRCNCNDEWISPSEFIPVLEEMRHIIPLTRIAMSQAIIDLKQWYELSYEGYVSINLSALHFKTHFDLEHIENALLDAGLPRSAIRFEITEGVLIEKSDEVLKELTRIRDAGFELALDDFGTGYSSLSYLRRFPLSILKIDKSFIDDIPVNTDDHALVTSTINLAASLNMACITEGVERIEQVEFLLNQGCVLQQGYYFSRPVDAKSFTKLLVKNWKIA